MKRKTGLTGSEKGQGTIEYVLILMISIMIILGVLHQFSGAFRQYSEALFDGYIACLLETGELPGSTICESDYKAFQLADGKAKVRDASTGPVTNGGGGGGSGGGSGSNSGNNSSTGKGGGGGDQSNSNSGGSNEVRASGGPDGRGPTTVGSSGSGFLKPRSTAVAKVDAEKPEESSLNGSDSLLGKASSSYAGRASRDLGKKTQLDRNFTYYGQEDAEERAKDRAPTTKVSQTSEGGETLRPKKAIENVDRTPAKVKESDDSGFSFGYLIRLLLIIIIILVIVIFFGGQLLQISKSREK